MHESLIDCGDSKGIIKYIIIVSCFLIRSAFSILSSADTLIGINGNNRTMIGQGSNDAMNGRSENDQICLLLSNMLKFPS